MTNNMDEHVISDREREHYRKNRGRKAQKMNVTPEMAKQFAEILITNAPYSSYRQKLDLSIAEVEGLKHRLNIFEMSEAKLFLQNKEYLSLDGSLESDNKIKESDNKIKRFRRTKNEIKMGLSKEEAKARRNTYDSE